MQDYSQTLQVDATFFEALYRRGTVYFALQDFILAVRDFTCTLEIMTDDRKYTAYCGLYCHDCIPSKAELFQETKTLVKTLIDLNFQKYAEHKSKKYNIYGNFLIFMDLLKEIQRLECTIPCREGPRSEAGCAPDCRVRKCAVDKKFEGCWECESFRSCELLTPIKEFHPSLENNLEMIKRHGIDCWSDKRGKYYIWSRG